jgi:hypothetical protein
MKPALIGIAALALAFTAGQAQDEPRSALPPHPLDAVFEGRTERDCRNNILNNALYGKAFKEAMKAKAEQEEKYRKNPKLRDATPAQAARRRFLEVLNDGQRAAGEARKEEKGDPKKD